MSSFYAVANGKKKGVYMNWNDCKEQIEDFEKPVFKKFANYDWCFALSYLGDVYA